MSPGGATQSGAGQLMPLGQTVFSRLARGVPIVVADQTVDVVMPFGEAEPVEEGLSDGE